MLKRIDELAEQADLLCLCDPTKIPGRYVGYISVAAIERFAMCIVLEAIEACEKNNMLDLDAWQRSDQIKQHFGIE
jgi:hypothetical protein